jgi:hypothetical protein
MRYGIFKEYYSRNWTLDGNRENTGLVGTTANGVMYLSMLFGFALFSKKWAGKRQAAAIYGTFLATTNFLMSSFSTQAWHLIVTQGVLYAIGGSLIYSPTTLSFGEWYNTGNRGQGCHIRLGSFVFQYFRFCLSVLVMCSARSIWLSCSVENLGRNDCIN